MVPLLKWESPTWWKLWSQTELVMTGAALRLLWETSRAIQVTALNT
jgi:hypothetical protein